jgi:hypothetical protein
VPRVASRSAPAPPKTDLRPRPTRSDPFTGSRAPRRRHDDCSATASRSGHNYSPGSSGGRDTLMTAESSVAGCSSERQSRSRLAPTAVLANRLRRTFASKGAASVKDHLQERRQLQSRLLNAREDAEAAPGRIYVVPPGCWGYGDTRSRGAASSATPVSGDDVEVRNTWGHGLWSIFAGVRPCRRASPGGGDGPPLPRGGGTVERPDCDRLGRSPATIKAYFYDPS